MISEILKLYINYHNPVYRVWLMKIYLQDGVKKYLFQH
jgi:hypothetical protein